MKLYNLMVSVATLIIFTVDLNVDKDVMTWHWLGLGVLFMVLAIHDIVVYLHKKKQLRISEIGALINYSDPLIDRIIQALEFMIMQEFPKIENLSIKKGVDSDLVVTFNEGPYTKEEVENKIDRIRNGVNLLKKF